MFGDYNREGEVPEGLDAGVLGQAKVVREGRDATIVAYGGMTNVAQAAAEQLEKEGLAAEVVDLRTLRPWDQATVAASVSKTHRAVVVEECPPVCGIAAEVAANLYELVFDDLDGPIVRVSGADVPLPYAKNLEQACIPHAADVVGAVRKIC